MSPGLYRDYAARPCALPYGLASLVQICSRQICRTRECSHPLSPPHKKSPNKGLVLCGGERGIRTLDTRLAYTHFPGVLLQPLGHLSGNSFCFVRYTLCVFKQRSTCACSLLRAPALRPFGASSQSSLFQIAPGDLVNHSDTSPMLGSSYQVPGTGTGI